MSRATTFIIAGGGLAGAKAAEALRDKDFDGHIILFAEEEHLDLRTGFFFAAIQARRKNLGIRRRWTLF